MTTYNIYKTDGIELRLAPIKPLIFTRFGVEFDKRKPAVPTTETSFAGGKKGIRYDGKDEVYLDLMGEFEMAKFQATIEFCIKYCVVDEPPLDFVVPSELGENTLENRKIVWVLGLLGEADATADFISACLGQNMPVEEEIIAETDAFKSDDRREAFSEIPIPQQ